MTKEESRKRNGLRLMALGACAILSAAVLVVHNEREQQAAAQESNQALLQLQSVQKCLQTEETVQLDDDTLAEIEINGESYIGQMRIPALDLELPVMSQWSYPRLKKAPCRYSGTVLGRDLVLLAHNYPNHFGKLKELPLDAEIFFQDVHGEETRYRLAALEILDPKRIEEITAEEYDLTLFTCTYGGKSRVVARCVMEEKT